MDAEASGAIFCEQGERPLNERVRLLSEKPSDGDARVEDAGAHRVSWSSRMLAVMSIQRPCTSRAIFSRNRRVESTTSARLRLGGTIDSRICLTSAEIDRPLRFARSFSAR